MTSIGIVHSCFNEKFGTPRQAGLVPNARADIEIYPDYAMPEAWRGLDTFSHIWVVFLFNRTAGQGWKPTVRPPRLGGNKRVGVFSTRSNFRPNPIGISAVRLHAVKSNADGLRLEISGVDIVAGTPVLDIKPYLPYADSFFESRAGYAGKKPEPGLTIRFAPAVKDFCEARKKELPHLSRLIVETLEQDPRPAYLRNTADVREFGVVLCGLNVRWRVKETGAEVFSIESL